MKKALIASLAISVLLVTLLHSRFGVFIVFDILGDVGSDNLITDSHLGPLNLTRSLTADTLVTLPGNIEQASGLHRLRDGLLLSTDQAELFELDDSGSLRVSKTDLLGGPLLLKQGSLEGIAVDDEVLLGIGELGAVARWRREGSSWQRTQDLALPVAVADFEFTGLTVHGDQLWASTDDSLLLVNLSTGEQVRPDLAAFLKAGREQSELLLSGLASDGEYLYLLSENYASLIVYSTATERVVEVIGIDPIEASDLAISKGRAWVSVDHNYFDARPPLYIYDLISE